MVTDSIARSRNIEGHSNSHYILFRQSFHEKSSIYVLRFILFFLFQCLLFVSAMPLKAKKVACHMSF